jgi:hypothetical protein
MKLPIFIVFFITWGVSAQQKSIVNILNKELKKEIRNQLKNRYFDGDTTTILQPFTISKENILSLKVRKYNISTGEYMVELQEVSLDSIKSIDKDINVLFRTEKEAVTVTISKEGNEPAVLTTNKSHLFFTHIRTLKDNESLGNSIQAAFKKAGFLIEKEYWYD